MLMGIGGLQTHAFVSECSADQEEPNSSSAVEMNAPKEQNIFSIAQRKSIRHTNSWITSAGLMGINHIQEAKTGTA